MAMLHLLFKFVCELVQTLGRVPKSEQAIVGRPIQRAQRRSLLPLFGSQACRSWYDDVKRDAGGSGWLKSEHDIRLNHTHLVPTDEFRKAPTSLEVFV